MKKFKKIWNSVATVLVVIVVLLALALAGVKLFGLKVFSVLSGSMEPTYHVGSVIYVKDVDPKDVKVGDPITFVLNESLTVATHRVVEINTGEDGMLRFKTKGDANQTEDGGKGVHEKNLIGRPVFTIPYLGYLAAYIQDPPGRYIAIALVVLLLLLFILPDLLIPEDRKKK
ncbi:MAG: signal peptidase I [Firmicutes bacterium]|nr:signal peptidase I [Bacillota bacterium]MBQ2311296.1 signal peptidase I [Bacillota bacterium]MBQ3930797.1 signal peptidase I [Bacillota bacterium]